MTAAKIGSKLYKNACLGAILEYTILSEHITKYKDREVTTYTARCESCNHGCDKCQVVVAPDAIRKNVFTFVSMLNNDDEDDQSYWHVCDTREDDLYYGDKNACILNRINILIKDKNKTIADTQKRLESLKKDLERNEQDKKLYQELIDKSK